MGQTVVEKILSRAAGARGAKAGDVVEPRVDLAMSHENAALVINQFQEVWKGTGRTPKVWDPSRIAIIFDHRVPAESPKTATNQKKVREFVSAQGIRRFHDVRGDTGGICHQILPEYGYVRPGTVVVGTDSHTTSHGALGAFAFGIGATEMASVWTLGAALNVEVPATIKVVVRGTFPGFVGPKDLILHLIGKISAQGANFRVLEFHGETIRKMPTSGRLVLCNMSVEAGATAGIVPADDETVRYLREEAGVDGPARPRLSGRRRGLRAGPRDRRLRSRAADRLSAHRRQRQAGRGRRRGPRPSGRHRLLHERPARRPRRRGRPRPRTESRRGDPDARLPRFGQDLDGGAQARLRRRLHHRGSRRHERRAAAPASASTKGRSGTARSPSPRRTGTSRGGWGTPPPRSISAPPPSPRPRPWRASSPTRGKERAEMAKVVCVLPDDVSTDVIYPGRYMATVLPSETPQFAFADDAAFNARLKAKEIPPGSRHRRREELRLRLFPRAGGLHAQGARARHRGRELRPDLSPELDQPRPPRRHGPRDRGERTGTTSRSSPAASRTGRPGRDWAVVPLPAARQAIIDAGGLIAYTRKRLLQSRA